MRWPFAFVFSSVLCFTLCTDTDGNGIKNETESAVSTESWLSRSNSSDSLDNSTAGGTTPPYNEKATKGRALNFTFPDTGNTVVGENKTRPLDDLSLDDVPMLVMHTHDTSTLPTTATMSRVNTTGECLDGDGRRHEAGAKFDRGCEESCECGSDGRITCRPRCEAPLFRKGQRKDDQCEEVPTSDECCVTIRCTQDTEVEPLEGCVHKNQTFQRGQMFNDGCEAVCSCGDAGKVHCKPRCPQAWKNSSDQCVHVPDPADPCCTVVFCDVTLGDQDVNKISGTEETTTADTQPRLKSADALNSTSAIVHFLGEPELESNLTAEVSLDQVTWNRTKLDGAVVHDLEPGKTYHIRIMSGEAVSNAVAVTLPRETPEIRHVATTTMTTTTTAAMNESVVKDNSTEEDFSMEKICHFKGNNYTIGEEFYDACISYCICTEAGIHCSPIECPSEFGLELLDPHCIKWETRPRDFNPVPPHCCPDKIRCLNNGSCEYEGQVFPNWEEIPSSLTGCEKKCFCEYGNITCQEVCPPVPATPPADLPCPPQHVVLHHPPGDDCCLSWMCSQLQHPEQNKTTKAPTPPPPDKKPKSEERPTQLGPPYKLDVGHKTDGKHSQHNILAPFGLDEDGHPTEPPLPGPVALPPGYEKDTSAIPGPPYIDHGEHHKTYGFKSSKDEGIHGPPPFVVKPTKEDLVDKKHKYPGPVGEGGSKAAAAEGNKSKTKSKGEFKPTLPPEDVEEEEEEEDYDEGLGHFPQFHPRPPGQPHVIYVNHPIDVHNPHGRPLPNEIFHGQNDPSLYHPLFNPDGKGSPKPSVAPVPIPNFPPPPPIAHPRLPQDRRPLPIGLYDGDEEAVLHYHAQDLPDDPRVLAKEILDHLHNTQANGVTDQAFGAQRPFNATNNIFAIHHPNVTGFNAGNGGFPAHPAQSGVNIQVLEPLDEHTVRLAFSVPPVLVGLHGRVEVRYTATKHGQDPSTWELQVLAPPGDLIATPQLHFELGNLLPDTTYSIMIKIILRDLANMPQSPILTVRTLPASSPHTTLPPQISVDSGLAVAEVNSTWAKLIWRKFSEFELQFIDGVQLRYREEDGKVFSATPLIHRLVTSYKIADLKPNSSYEMGLFFIPFPGQTTELESERNIKVQTPVENDPYKFDINLEILSTKANSVEVTWSGVPYPEDKYVNIYRVIYQSEVGKEDFNNFKVAKRDSTPKMTIDDLKPTTRYRLWLEAYLTNGRTKKSNVQDFVSKPGSATSSSVGPTFQGKLSGTPPTMEPGDYYGPLVAVAILAALAIMAALILFLVLMRKHGQNKAAITSTRKTQSAYDNPSYKTCEGDAPAANGNGVSRDRNVEAN